jgi:hypothetical protein
MTVQIATKKWDNFWPKQPRKKVCRKPFRDKATEMSKTRGKTISKLQLLSVAPE